jgi:hypothetical protein
MEDIELRNIWQAYDRKIEEARVLNLQSWALNLRCFEALQTEKARHKLSALSRFKGWVAALGVLWVVFLALLVLGSWFSNPYFTVSVGMIMLFNVYAVAVYIRHIYIIRQINYGDSITSTQEKLAVLKLSTINSTRILMLQMPFYTTWFWHRSWLSFSSSSFWLVTFPITLMFTLLAIFLYRNISLKNMHKKWLKLFMMAGPEYKSLLEAQSFIAEIDEFKNDLTQAH